jgi:hydroxymethylpyrimidine/phosphomethylpyrimidine kinase
MKSVLCINGSDSMGHAGIQADIRTIKDLRGYAVTAVTAVTIQNSMGITDVHELPTTLVTGQVKAVYEETIPNAVKVGMIDNAETISAIAKEILGCPNIVCSPVILASHGGLLMSNDSLVAYQQDFFPICKLLIIKCTDAEILLGRRINTDADMTEAATLLHDMGPQWILLRGGTFAEGRINALLLGPECKKFFSSMNIEGWQRHGVGGTLSTAIAARLAQGDDVPTAITNAHNYMHSQVIYASSQPQALQPHNLYNQFMTLLSEHYITAHDVSFYATQLSISTRYLSQITKTVSGRSPKQVIDDYLVQECEQLLSTTSLTIQQVSQQLGFTSQIAFAKFFKAKKKIAPTVYRANRFLHQ